MLGGAHISACVVLAATPAVAQTVLDGHGRSAGVFASVADVWTEFERSCSEVLSDPAAFVVGHPTVGANNLQLVHRSEDGQVLVLDHTTDAGVFRQIELIGVPGELHVLCQISGGDEAMGGYDPTRYGALTEATYRELTDLLAERGIAPVGGAMPIRMPSLEALSGVHVPVDLYSYILGFQAQIAGETRFVYANVSGTALYLTGQYVILAEAASETGDGTEGEARADAAAPDGAREPGSASGGMAAFLETCLRNYRTPDNVLPALESAGMTIVQGIDAGTWEVSGPQVSGIVAMQGELFCSIQSQEVPLDAAQAIGSDLAYALFPDMVQPGAPEGGKGPCDGLSIFAPRQLIWLRYAQAGNSGECINDGTSAIIMN